MINRNTIKYAVFSVIVLIIITFLSGCRSFKSSDVQDDVITGSWEQYMLVEKDYIYGGTFFVSFTDEKYSMEYFQKRDDLCFSTEYGVIGITNSLGLYDISFKNGIWQFKSDWGSGNTGEFRLVMKSRDIFEGWSYLDGDKKTYNLWKRVK